MSFTKPRHVFRQSCMHGHKQNLHAFEILEFGTHYACSLAKNKAALLISWAVAFNFSYQPINE